MNLRRESTKAIITLSETSLLGAGGEARVYALPQEPSLVAKIYHQPNEQRARKLRAMLANPPHDAQTGASIIWPVDLLRTIDAQQQIAGFLMPRVTQMRRVMDIYHPKTRRQECPLFNYLYLQRTGRNLAAAMKALHARGYVIGDVNESNILVSETALVTLVDADSFQVRDPASGEIYRCAVGKAEFTPPELQGRIFADLDRAPEHDLFGLAVLLFQLLLEGTHPFAGVYLGSAEPPPLAARISAGHFSYGAGKQAPYRPMPVAPPFGILPPRLRQLFVQAFHTGHQQPQARPDAQMWADALKEAEEALRTCAVNSQHRYGDHLLNCPWCERAQRLGGRDPFPSPQAVQKREHLRPAPRKSTPPRPPAYRPTPRVYRPQPVIFQSYNPPAPPPSRWAAVKQGLGSLFRAWWVLLILGNLVRLATCNSPSQPLRKVYESFAPLPEPVRLKGLPPLNGKVNSLAFAPNGQLIAVGCGDKMAKLFDAQSGKLQRTLAGYSDAVSAVAFSPDGKLLVTGGYDRTMRWWNVRDGSQRLSVKAHDGPVSSVAVAPDGLTVASGSFDQSLKLWDVRYGALKNNLGGHTGAIYSICFSPYDALASGSRDGSINIRKAPSGILSRTIITSEREVISESYGAVGAIAFSPKGDLVGSALSNGMLKLWWLSTGALHYTSTQNEAAYTIAFAPDGKTFVTGNADGELNYFQTLPGQRLKSFQAHQGAVHCLAFAPDGKTLASGGADGQVKIWRAGTEELRRAFVAEQ